MKTACSSVRVIGRSSGVSLSPFEPWKALNYMENMAKVSIEIRPCVKGAAIGR